MNCKISIFLTIWSTLVALCAGAGKRPPCVACSVGVPQGANQDTVPVLYHNVKGTGAGAYLYSMLFAAAYAESRGWIYGGTAEEPKVERKLIRFIFNSDFPPVDASKSTTLQIERASDLHKIKGPSWPATSIVVLDDDWLNLEKQCETVDFPRFKYSDKVPVLDSIFRPSFLKEIQADNAVDLRRTATHFKSNNPKAPRVAIHIRRGPLIKGPFASRKHSLDSYYFAVVEIIRSRYPHAEIHAFPLLPKGSDAPAVNETEYAGYEKRDITVHFDASIQTTWAHFISADIFVMAHSAFSSVPALLNPNCVVYDHFWLGKLDRHVTLHNFKEKFDQCYSSVATVPVHAVQHGIPMNVLLPGKRIG